MANEDWESLSRHGDAFADLEKYLGTVADTAQQSATADQTAADHGTPAPPPTTPDAPNVMPPQPGGIRAQIPNAPDGPGALPPELAPSANSTVGQPISDEQAAALRSQPTQTFSNMPSDGKTTPLAPPAGQNAAPIDSQTHLTPTGFANAATKSANDAIKQHESASEMQQRGLQEQAEADRLAAKQTEDAAKQRLVIDWQKQQALEAVHQRAQQAQKSIEAETRQHIDAQTAELQRDPTKWFDNHSTSQKIGAVIGMLTAGWSGRSAIGYLDDLINTDRSESNRRRGLHGEAIDQLRMLGGQQEKRFSDDANYANTRAVAAYQNVINQLEAKKSTTANPTIQANLDKAIGELRDKVADETDKINNTKFGNWAHAQQTALGYAHLQNDTEKMELARDNAAMKESNNYLQLEDREGGHGIPKAAGAPAIVKKHAAYQNGIRGLEGIRKSIAQLPENGALLTNEQIKVQQALLSGEIRNLQGAGANLQGREQEMMDQLMPGFSDYVKGKITGNELNEKIRYIQHALNRQDNETLQQIDANSQPRASTLSGQLFAEEQASESAKSRELAAVRNAMTLQPKARDLALRALAKNGNSVAADMLKRFDKQYASDFYMSRATP